MSAFDCDVAIVGTGPTGLVLAHLLAQAGVRTCLIEKASNKIEPMETHLKHAMLNTKNVHTWEAGIEPFDFPAKSGRDRERMPIAAFFRRNFPGIRL